MVIEAIGYELEHVGTDAIGGQTSRYKAAHLLDYMEYKSLCGLGAGKLYVSPALWREIGRFPGISCRECLKVWHAKRARLA